MDDVEKARRELDDLAEHLELDSRQGICPACNLVFWKPVGRCTNCPT